MGNRSRSKKHRPPPAPQPNPSSLICCGSTGRLSESSTSPDATAAALVAHAAMHERLERMARGSERRKCVVLVAVDKRSEDPKEDFGRSMMEVIVAEGMAEPRELRRLLNCYVSLNAAELRGVILETFHDVCAGLFAPSLVNK